MSEPDFCPRCHGPCGYDSFGRLAPRAEDAREAPKPKWQTEMVGWLIEVPRSTGAEFWCGSADDDRWPNLHSHRDQWCADFGPDANKAVRFRSEHDAKAVMRLFPTAWGIQDRVYVTEHRWLISTAESRALAARTEPDVAALRARLAALTEVHEFYEFDATTEEQFDAWLHERIKEVRGQLGIGATDSPSGAPVLASDFSRSTPNTERAP